MGKVIKRGSNIILIGFMGAGKTIIGQALANELGWPFVDTDREIEIFTGKSIPDLFLDGEEYFRNIESNIILKICQEKNRDISRVISAGGGVILKKENVKRLKECGVVVYLRAEAKTLKKRLNNEKELKSRPLFFGKDFNKEFEKIFASRGNLYSRYADIIIDTDNLKIDQVVKILIKLLKERGYL